MLFFKKKQKSAYKTLKDLKGIHEGERCFIIGNGPSLRFEDLDKLKNEYTFAVNRIYLGFDKTVWRPTYYAIQDSKILDQYAEDVANLDLPYKFIPKQYEAKVNNKKGTAFYYNYQVRLFDGTSAKFSEDISEVTYEGGTVTFLCMQIAFYMGFKEIILLGNDFNYSLEKTKDGIVVSNVKDYFVDNYIGNKDTRFYPRIDLCAVGFKLAREKAEEKGIKILNATRGGKLEVFERVDFDSLNFKG